MASPAFLLNLLEQLQDHLPQVIALLRDTDGGVAPVTPPSKADMRSSTPPPAPKKAVSKVSKTSGAEPLEEPLLNAMLKAGIKPGAHAKVLVEKVFTPEGIPEELHADARVQWKKWRADITDDDAATVEQEPVLSKENLETLKNHGGFYDKTQVRKLAPEFLALGIPHVLHEKASKEWREYAKTIGLVKEDSPKLSPAPAPASKSAPPVLLSQARLEMLKANDIPSNAELEKLSPWFVLWKIPNEMIPVAAATWYRWARDNGVPAEETEEDLDI